MCVSVRVCMCRPTARSVCIKVSEENASQVLMMAVEKGFDWVHYTTKEYVTLSVAPDKGPLPQVLASSYICI